MQGGWIPCRPRRAADPPDTYGLAGTDLVQQLHRVKLYADAEFISEPDKLRLTEVMAQVEYRLVEGGARTCPTQ